LKTWRRIKHENKTNFYMNLHLKDGFGVEFTAYEGQMMKEVATVALTLFTLYYACCGFAPHVE